jgi:hypothetical protein
VAGVTWRALLLVYPHLEVTIDLGGRARRFAHAMSEGEISDALASFARLPELVRELSDGEANLSAEVARIPRPLDSLTAMGVDLYWPSPSDTAAELATLAPPRRYDSLFVLWPQKDLKAGTDIPSGGWGLALAASDWSNGASYATVANIRREVWAAPVVGEVWLHEWLHGVCGHYAARGFPMPPGDADGGERNGYRQSAATGWSEYYRDLMRGRVLVEGRASGITPAAWRTGSILSAG